VGLVFLIPWHRPVSVPVATIELAALRGGATPLAQARAGSELDLKIDLTGLPLPASYRIEIVDAAGRPQWTGTATVRESTLVTRVTRHLASGVYWVRLFSESAELLREFGLKLG
jgi:hypothetical protein